MLVERVLQLFCASADVVRLAVVTVAVLPDEAHVFDKLRGGVVAVVKQFLANC
jgi:hypothetical protein